MKSKEYKNRVAKLKSEYSKSREKLKITNKNLESIKDKSGELIEINKKNIYYIDKTINLIDSFPDENKSSESTDFDQAFDTASEFAELLFKQSISLEERSKDYKSSFNILVSGTNVTGSTTDVASGSMVYLASEFAPIHAPTKKAFEEYNLPSLFDKKEEIEEWLVNINSTIKAKYSEAYYNFNNSKFMSACHALRDCLSQFWEHLAPDEEVEDCPWFKKVPGTGRPTQKQRIKFIIIGNSDDSILPDHDIDTIDKLMDEGREIYTKLTIEAHSRTGNWEEKRTRAYFEITNNFLLTIKVLKSKL